MPNPPINHVLADNLRHFMERKGMNQTALGKASGVKQNTISLYLDPDRRMKGASGKEPSAKLTEVAMLADALGIEPWQLVRSMTESERAAYEKIEDAYRALFPGNFQPVPNGLQKAA